MLMHLVQLNDDYGTPDFVFKTIGGKRRKEPRSLVSPRAQRAHAFSGARLPGYLRLCRSGPRSPVSARLIYEL